MATAQPGATAAAVAIAFGSNMVRIGLSFGSMESRMQLLLARLTFPLAD